MTTVGLIQFSGFAGVAGNQYADYYKRFLGPKEWQSRTPWFGSITGLDTQTSYLSMSDQDIVDDWIKKAHRCGIDYFAYDYYPSDNTWYGSSTWCPGINNMLRLHMSSAYAELVKICPILVGDTLCKNQNATTGAASYNTADWTDIQSNLVEMLTHSAAFKVQGTRPLVFFLNPQLVQAGYGGGSTLLTDMNALTSAVSAAGGGNLYISSMSVQNVTNSYAGFSSIGADGVSTYFVNTLTGTSNPFSALVTIAEGYWDALAAGGAQVIPTVMAGFDLGPVGASVTRGDYPASTGASASRGPYALLHTSAELAAHLQNALDWCAAHPGNNDADTVIIYADTEFAEGGRCCPRKEDGGMNYQFIAKQLQRQRDTRGTLRSRGVNVNSR